LKDRAASRPPLCVERKPATTQRGPPNSQNRGSCQRCHLVETTGFCRRRPRRRCRGWHNRGRSVSEQSGGVVGGFRVPLWRPGM